MWRMEGFVNLLDWVRGRDSHPKGVDELESHPNQATGHERHSGRGEGFASGSW